MSSIWTIARHEYLVNVRRAGFIFFTLLIPALGAVGLVVAAFFSGQASGLLRSQFVPAERQTGVVDHSGLFVPIDPEFADRFTAFADEASARRDLLASAIGAYIVIPADYVRSGEITAYSLGRFTGVALTDSDATRAFLLNGLLAEQVAPETLERARDPLNVTPITLDSSGQPTTGANIVSAVAGFIIPYLLSILLVISIFTSSSYLLRSVSEEKETRVIEVVLSSVSARQLLAGKVLGLGAVGLTQIGVWVLSGFAFSGGLGAIVAGAAVLLRPQTFLLAVVYFLLGYLVYGTGMAAAGALGTSMRESQQLAGIFSFAAAIPYMVVGIVFANPNAALVRLLSYIPLTAPTMMMLRLPLSEVPWIDVAASLTILLATIPFVLWAGAKIFRLGLLMYGKRPALRQILRVLRQA